MDILNNVFYKNLIYNFRNLYFYNFYFYFYDYDYTFVYLMKN